MMNQLTDFSAEEFVVYIAIEAISDWSLGSDESGHAVLDRKVICLYLNGVTC